MESKIEFPFCPLKAHRFKWKVVLASAGLDPSENKFLKVVEAALGSDPRSYTHVFFVDLLSVESFA